MRYILAYFALMLGLSGVSLLFAERAEGFLLVLIAGILVYILVRVEQARRRERRYGGYDMAIEGYERHFTDVERELEARIPDDALESPAMLELLSAAGDDEDDAASGARSSRACTSRTRPVRSGFRRSSPSVTRISTAG
jgi:hypothetical protein